MILIPLISLCVQHQGRGESLPWFPLPRGNASFAPRLDGGVQVPERHCSCIL
jgi:hypothetical protein